MTKRLIPIALLAGLVAGVTAYATATTRSGRPDCPGRIVCPVTGEPVCRDRCPLGAQAAAAERPACCRDRGERP